MKSRKRIPKPSNNPSRIVSMLSDLYNLDYRTVMRAYSSQGYKIGPTKQILSLINN